MTTTDEKQMRGWKQAAFVGLCVTALAFPWVNSEWKGGALQALGGALLLGMPSGLAVWGVLAARHLASARIALRALLALAVLLSLAGVHSYGVFTTPLLLPMLWLTCRRTGGLERALWILATGICSLLLGVLIAVSFGLNDLAGPFTALIVMALFAASSGTSATAVRP